MNFESNFDEHILTFAPFVFQDSFRILENRAEFAKTKIPPASDSRRRRDLQQGLGRAVYRWRQGDGRDRPLRDLRHELHLIVRAAPCAQSRLGCT